MASPLELEFLTSATDYRTLPATTAEVAVVGRSNVGKSSLINSLANRKSMAQTSKTPGRTRLINIYERSKGGTFVDLPGYGYANVPHKMRDAWAAMIESYLLERDHLDLILVLVDGAIGPTDLDVSMIEWLESYDLPYTVVATKYDKVKAAKRDRRKKDLAEGCDLDPREIMWVSAAKGTGLEPLRTLIVHVLDRKHL